jgi:spore germination cell wall hydrolase CwlJ-like protein
MVAAQACSTGLTDSRRAQLQSLAHGVGGFSPRAEARLERTMGADVVVLAAGLGGRRDLAGRPEGWAVLDIADAPSLGFARLSPEEAERINAFLPASGEPSPPAAPFLLKGGGPERERALLCLTQAIYYEAALEPAAGQQAVAQAVLNRVRSPAFPASICGVVYQGSQQVTGCQFSFTCDGSRDRPPIAPFWLRARAVAEQAVSGFVMTAVGTATHYHADYVFPRWGPTLVKIGQIGAHIFYRFPGPLGRPPSFRKPYAGGELRVSMAGPSPAAILAARAAEGDTAATAPVQFEVADPTVPEGMRKRVAGEIVFGRRIPTHEEIAAINSTLAKMDQPPASPPAVSSPAPSAAPAHAESPPTGK